jgi:conjugal transfer pilus assembly protein TrbC
MISRLSLAGIGGFMALAAVSAALAPTVAQTVAQTVDGLDLGAIKARGADQVKDAQVFVDAVAGRGEPHKAEAEELREQGIAAMSAIDPASLPQGTAGPVDFDEILGGAAANAQAPMGEGPLLVVFASLSMPQASLSVLIRDTTRAGGVVVFRGFPQNSTKAFAEGLKRVVTDEAQEAHIAIDPRLFRAFKVTAAPTFVVTGRSYELCDGFDCSSSVPDHDRMAGNVTVEYALESFAGARGPGAGVAGIALANLRKQR